MGNTNANETQQDLYLAFRLGRDLYEYCLWAEVIWASPATDAQKRVDGFLERFRRSMIRTVDQLTERGRWKNDEQQAELSKRLLRFPDILLRLLEYGTREQLQKELSEAGDFCQGEFGPEYPREALKKLESLRRQLFSIPSARVLGTAFTKLEQSARRQVNDHVDLVIFFRLGFEILRATDPIRLDDVFEIEPSGQSDAPHLAMADLSLDILLNEARECFSGLGDIKAIDYSDGYDLRDEIDDLLNGERENWMKYRLGLRLKHRSKVVGREGCIDEFSLEDKPALWSLLTALALLEEGETIHMEELTSIYKSRTKTGLANKGGTEGETKPEAVRRAIGRLNYGGEKSGDQKLRFLDDIGLQAISKSGYFLKDTLTE